MQASVYRKYGSLDERKLEEVGKTSPVDNLGRVFTYFGEGTFKRTFLSEIITDLKSLSRAAE